MEANPARSLSGDGENEAWDKDENSDDNPTEAEVHIDDGDPIHDYNEDDDSDASRSEDDFNSDFDEEYYAALKKIMYMKRGRAIGLAFKDNGNLVPNSQLAYLLRTCKLALYGPYEQKDFDTGPQSSKFCPSLRDVPLRLCGMTFRQNGRMIANSIFIATLKKSLLSTQTEDSESLLHENDLESSYNFLRYLGLDFDLNGAVIWNSRFQAMLEGGDIIPAASGNELDCLQTPKSNKRFYFKTPSSYYDQGKPTQVFRVYTASKEAAQHFEYRQEKFQSAIAKAIEKAKKKGKTGLIQSLEEVKLVENQTIPQPFEEDCWEELGKFTFTISVDDILVAMEDEEKQRQDLSGINNTLARMPSINEVRYPKENPPQNLLLYGSQSCLANSTAKIISFFNGDKELQIQEDENEILQHPYLEEDSSIKETLDLLDDMESLMNDIEATGDITNIFAKSSTPQRNFSRTSPMKMFPVEWKPIRYTVFNTRAIRSIICDINKVVVHVNKQAIMILDLLPKTDRPDARFPFGFSLERLCKCWFRAKIIA